MKTQSMASSSSSWPNKLSVAWKYIELNPTTINNTQSRCIPGVTKRPYSLNSIIKTGGSKINRKLLNCKGKSKKKRKNINKWENNLWVPRKQSTLSKSVNYRLGTSVQKLICFHSVPMNGIFKSPWNWIVLLSVIPKLNK